MCSCGRTTLSDLRSVDEQTRWGDRLGGCWDYNDNDTAYWFYCLECHRRKYPHDRRHFGNRYGGPAPAWLHVCLHATTGGRQPLTAGVYFYLTTPPPERRPSQEQVSENTVRQVRRRISVEPSASSASASASRLPTASLEEPLLPQVSIHTYELEVPSRYCSYVALACRDCRDRCRDRCKTCRDCRDRQY